MKPKVWYCCKNYNTEKCSRSEEIQSEFGRLIELKEFTSGDPSLITFNDVYDKMKILCDECDEFKSI